jgi:hypothetical protein
MAYHQATHVIMDHSCYYLICISQNHCSTDYKIATKYFVQEYFILLTYNIHVYYIIEMLECFPGPTIRMYGNNTILVLKNFMGYIFYIFIPFKKMYEP